jgi:Tol biopolymer transport system component
VNSAQPFPVRHALGWLLAILALGAIAVAIAVAAVASFAFHEIGDGLGGGDSGDTSLSWTPDGKHIVVSRGQDESEALYRLNADGSDPERLTSRDSAAEDPAVSPDGKKIAYVAIPGPWVDVYVASADGSDARSLTNGDKTEADSAWSPNGREIAFIRGYDLDFQSDLYIMRADGTQVRRRTRGSDLEEAPAWSPDGAWIAYEAYPGVYVVPAHGRGKRRLVTNGLASPAWSPDGKHLAVVEDQTTIKVVNMVTRKARRVVVSQLLGPAEYPTAPEDLAWSPDEKRIAYTADGSLYTVRLSDGTARRLTHCVPGGDAHCGA